MFCAFLHARCTELGLITHIATPTSLDQGTRTVHITSAKGELAVPYDRLIFSVGPWSAPTARSLGLPVPPVSNLPGHSILIRPARDGGFDPCAETETVFAGLSGRRTGTEAADAEPSTGGVERNGGYTRSVEFVTRYALSNSELDRAEVRCGRPSGVVYLAGENSIPHKRDSIHEESKTANHLPANPAQVIGLVDNVLVSRLVTAAAMTSPLLDLKRGAKLEKAQLCYRPTTMDGNPLIGRSGGEGMFLAAGHGPWVSDEITSINQADQVLM
jgi:glycine/D-amino acid oxidase-like deaminating enzyme